MKRFILLFVLLLSCSKEPQLVIEGEWSLDRMESIEEYQLFNWSFTTDTTFKNIKFIFEDGIVYTIKNDTVMPIPIIGFHFQNNAFLSYTHNNNELLINYEPWEIISNGKSTIILENETNYGIVGNQVRTLYLNRK